MKPKVNTAFCSSLNMGVQALRITQLGAVLPLLLLLSLFGRAVDAQTCQTNKAAYQLQLANDASDLTTLNSNMPNSGYALTPEACDFWVLDFDTYLDNGRCTAATGYLLLEFYRMTRSSGAWTIDTNRLIDDIYFVASRESQPQISVSSSGVATLTPPLAGSSSDSADKVTWVDLNGDAYQRPHHRLLIQNISSLNDQGNPSRWYVTVANLNSKGTSTYVQGYLLRATCLLPEEVPCPRPLPYRGGCSNPVSVSPASSLQRGQCVQPSSGVPADQQCTCNDGYGDYGCNLDISTARNSGTTVRTTVSPGQWKYLQIKMPISQVPSGAKPTLLVEATRTVFGMYSGDPILVVKPVDTNDRNVPWFTDMQTYGDLKSYFLQQDYHFILTRSISLSGTGAFYVGIYNNVGRWGTASYDTVISITVRWSLGGPSATPLCPADCYDRGTCTDPYTTALTSMLDPNTNMAIDTSLGYVCTCQPGYGGTICEGTLKSDVSISTSTTTLGGTLAAGSWDFYTFVLDPKSFNSKYDDLSITWSVTDAMNSRVPSGSIVNAFFTLNEGGYPRQAQYDSIERLKQGWQVFYSELANPGAPLTVQNSILKSGARYVIGVYNSDYQRASPYKYSLQVVIPSSAPSWLHPYMSVVLGVTAAVILCLMMTLCKRFIQRHGFGLWRRRRQEVEMEGRTVIQIVPRTAPGVPANIVDTFPVYEWQPPPASAAAKKAAAAAAAAETDPEAAAAGKAQRLATQAAMAAMTTEAATKVVAAAAVATASAGQEKEGKEAGEGGEGQGEAGADAATAAAGGDAAGPSQQQQQEVLPAGGDAAGAAGAGPSSGGAAAAAAVAGMAPVGAADDESPTCTVCLCEYEAGDSMRRLPCNHEFHQACIDKWMSAHTTCPMCREPLVPEGMEQSQQGGDYAVAMILPAHIMSDAQAAAMLAAELNGMTGGRSQQQLQAAAAAAATRRGRAASVQGRVMRVIGAGAQQQQGQDGGRSRSRRQRTREQREQQQQGAQAPAAPAPTPLGEGVNHGGAADVAVVTPAGASAPAALSSPAGAAAAAPYQEVVSAAGWVVPPSPATSTGGRAHHLPRHHNNNRVVPDVVAGDSSGPSPARDGGAGSPTRAAAALGGGASSPSPSSPASSPASRGRSGSHRRSAVAPL